MQEAVTEARASIEDPRVPLSDPQAMSKLFGDWHGAGDIEVTAETMLRVPAVWCAVNFLSGTIAGLPLQVFAKKDGSREMVSSDPLYSLLHDAPNDELTSFQWRKGMMVSALSTGRGLSFIERNKAGRPMNIWPLETEKTTIERKSGRKLYHYKDGDRTVTYNANEIIDIPFMLKADGLSHVDPAVKLKGAVGLAIALEDYARKFFANGGVPPLVLQGPMPSPGAASRAASDIDQAVRDANAERRNVLIMPAGHELKPVGVDPEKSQMEAARRFQIEEIARVFDLPPVFLQDLTHGTFSNTEQQDLAFLKHTLTQWLKCWEQELNLKLFSARNRTRYVEFNLDGILRGDFKTRMDGYAIAIQNAINTPDEVREMENWPKKGGDADKLHVQGGTVPLGQQKMQGATPANDNQDEGATPDDET